MSTTSAASRQQRSSGSEFTSFEDLADVLTCLQAKGSYALAKDVLDVARVALQVNVAKEGQRLPRSASKELKALVG